MSDYRNELLERYSEPPEPHTKDEWVEMLLHGDQSDSDIMKLVAERDALRAKLEIARVAMKNFIERFDDESDTSMDSSVWAIEGIREALQKIKE